MAINPNIPLAGTNVVPEFKNVLAILGERQRQGQVDAEAPARNRILDAQAGIAESQVPTATEEFDDRQKALLKSVAAISRSIIPDLQSGNNDLVIQKLRDRTAQLKAAGIDSSNTEKATLLAMNNPEELLRVSQNAVALDTKVKNVKPVFKEGLDDQGNPKLFSVTPQGAEQIPGITPIKKQPLVQIGGGNASEQKELGKLRAQDLKSIREKSDQAEQQITSLNVLDNIDVSTGAAEPMKQAIATFAEGFGVDASGLANVAAGQAFTAEAGRTVLRVMATQKGPQTDKDADRIAKTLSRLGNRPEANKFINDSARAVANRAIDQRAFYDDFLDKNDSLKGVASQWNKVKRNTPMISETQQDANGLPLFYFRFRERVREANEGVTDEQILNAWRRQEKESRKGRK